MNDRFGPRIVLAISGTAYGIGFILLSQVSAPWQMFVIFGVFMAMGLGAHDVVTLSTIARWFDKRRGIMSGVVKTGTALGQVMVPPLAALLLFTLWMASSSCRPWRCHNTVVANWGFVDETPARAC